MYGFAKQSGGHVKIYSEVGQGTTVKTCLPRLLGNLPDNSVPDETLNPEATQEETILVVEDDDDVRFRRPLSRASAPICPGQIMVHVTEPPFDTLSGQTLLVPLGTRMTGIYDSRVTPGQSRVFLVWTWVDHAEWSIDSSRASPRCQFRRTCWP